MLPDASLSFPARKKQPALENSLRKTIPRTYQIDRRESANGRRNQPVCFPSKIMAHATSLQKRQAARRPSPLHRRRQNFAHSSESNALGEEEITQTQSLEPSNNGAGRRSHGSFPMEIRDRHFTAINFNHIKLRLRPTRSRASAHTVLIVCRAALRFPVAGPSFNSVAF
ncbi:hypothetical protein BaRGS_00010581 [Batillaria attramentaria]|uniref:Uncharacterized protein n=1 Tax=Batillaria attramentaria TaxID=370345 RepID=A0ABD0LG41_9CAEN